MKTTSERWSTSQDALSFRELLGFLYRQKILLIVCIALGLAGWALALALIPAEYRVYTSFTIDAPTAGSNPATDPLSELTIADKVGDILTAIQVMNGEDVLGEAYRNAGATATRTADSYVGGPNVSITQAGYTNLIEVTVDSPNTDQATIIARDIPRLFATTTRRTRDQELERSVTFLTARQKDAAADVRAAAAAVGRYNEDVARRVGTNDQGEMASRRSSAILADEAAKADLDGAQERLDTVRAARAALPATVKNPSVTGSTARRNALIDQINALKADRAQQAVTFSDRSPSVRELDAKIAASEKSLAAIPRNDQTVQVNRNPQLDVYDDKVTEANAAVKGAQARLDKANAFLQSVEAQSNSLTKSLSQRASLEGEVLQRQKVLDLVNTRLEDLQVRRNAVRDAVAIVVPPSVQPVPVRPKPTLYLMIALVASTILGISFAVLKEHIDDRVTTPELAARETGAVILGVVPPLRGRERLTLADPRLPRRIADAARLIHQRIETIYGISADHDLRSIMLTSMARTEERSSVARNLAASFAAEGKSVILVSVGNTSLLETLGAYTSKTGYTELLVDPTKTAAVLVTTDIPGVRAVTRGSANAPLTATHIAAVHEQLTSLADVVVYDGPSYLFPFDVQSLGSVVDATAIVVKPGIPKRNILGVASDTLRGLRSEFLGVAITGSAAEEVTKDIVRFDDEAVA